MIFADNLLSPELQYGAFFLCLVLIGVLFWVIKFICNQNKNLSGRNKEQNRMIENHLEHIDETLKHLPCQRGACPEEET